MAIPPEVRVEWEHTHCLCAATLTVLHGLADPGDRSPIPTAIALLRAPLPSN